MPLIADGDHADSLHDTLEALERASETPVKQRSVKASSLVDSVCHHAFTAGLDENALRIIVRITSSKTQLDQTSVTTLIKNLYPGQHVASDIVISVVAALGQGKGKPSLGSQDGFVQWLRLIRHVTVDANILSRLYGVLFGMLDMISIRTSLCHLLSLITRRKHVRPFRIQRLLELARSLTDEPALQGLLRVYKDYYPDIILSTASTSRKSFPPILDPEWRVRLAAIRESSTVRDKNAMEEANSFKVRRNRSYRTSSSLIPDVHTFRSTETSVTLEEIDNVDDFVEKLDRIELPGQMISFLSDPLLQKYVELRASPVVSRRIELWLSTCLEEQYNAAKWGNVDDNILTEILDGLARHAQYTKNLLPITLIFLKEYVKLWNGYQCTAAVLSLLAHLPIASFEEVHREYLQPVEQAISNHNPQAQEHLISFYTNLLRHWINQATPQPPNAAPALSSPDQLAINKLVTHVSTLSTSLLLSLHPSSPTSTTLTSLILTFYELLSTSSTPTRIPIILPPTLLISLLLTSPSLTTTSRTARIIASYKNAFNAHPPPLKKYYAPDIVDAINATIRDIYNFLWIARALAASTDDAGKPIALGLSCHPSLRDALNKYLASLDRDYAIGTALGLSFSPLLASLSAAAWRDLEKAEIERATTTGEEDIALLHKGPVSQQSLEVLRRNGGVSMDWEGYKVYVLKWLEERGLAGLKEFMFASSEAVRRRYGGGV